MAQQEKASDNHPPGKGGREGFPDRPDWLGETTHKDWLFDGRPIRGEVMLAMWHDLDWLRAWVDLGPSIAGNPGPYWHVPLRSGDTVHRLYPKFLLGKWLPVVRQAIAESRTGAALGADMSRPRRT